MAAPNTSAIRALTQELKKLKDEPLEGFRVKLVNDENLFEWEVAIFGPPATIYQGGYFKARMRFPQDYPFNPPSLRFDKATLLFHPNVYESGDLCISILHPPTNDPHSGELPCERWNPTQSVRTILLSVVSLLNEPNTFSPANVDASVMFRRWKDSEGKDDAYEQRVKEQVAASRLEAEKDGVTVPTTLEDYVVKAPSTSATKSSLEIDNFGLDESDDDDIDYVETLLDDNSTDDGQSQSSTATDDNRPWTEVLDAHIQEDNEWAQKQDSSEIGGSSENGGGNSNNDTNEESACDDHQHHQNHRPPSSSSSSGNEGTGHSSSSNNGSNSNQLHNLHLQSHNNGTSGPRDRKGGGECMDESFSTNEDDDSGSNGDEDSAPSKKKIKLLHENSSVSRN